MPPLIVRIDATHGPLEVACFPGDDVAFGMTVIETAIGVEHGSDHSGIEVASRLMTRLRRAYPTARVEVRHELASWDRTRPLLYAFRDGSAGPAPTPRA